MALPSLPNYTITGPHLISGTSLNSIVKWLRGAMSFVTPNDPGATITLAASEIANNGSSEVYLRTTGGSTPSLTLPTAANLLAVWPDAIIGSSYRLRVINNNSGTATMVTNTGITTTGTLTLATNTWRDFVITATAVASPAVTVVSVGTGTDS